MFVRISQSAIGYYHAGDGGRSGLAWLDKNTFSRQSYRPFRTWVPQAQYLTEIKKSKIFLANEMHLHYNYICNGVAKLLIWWLSN
jgi:hypothetical protein